MLFLDELELFITDDFDNKEQEAKRQFDLYPMSYDLDSGVSFGVDDKDTEELLAKIIVRTKDGVPIDALSADYDYDDVYVDVNIEGDSHDLHNTEIITWVIDKFKSLGYNDDTVHINGKQYHTNPEDDVNDINAMDKPVESGEDIDISKYWGGETPEDEDTFDIDKDLASDDDDEEDNKLKV